LAKPRKIKPGERVVLRELPPGFLDDLPGTDQKAIRQILGKPVLVEGIEDDGRVELQFVDDQGDFHFIYVDPRFVRPE
jgi:hypothetical protein